MKKQSLLSKSLTKKNEPVIKKIIGTLVLLVALSLSPVKAGENFLSEKVHLKVDNVTLKDALKEIERQSTFTFLYNDALIDVNQTISYSSKEQTVKELLDQILDKRGISYTIIENQIVLTKAVKMQEGKRTITGKITDSQSNQGLPGVKILEKGTNNGTISDVDGNFTITVSDNAYLVISYLGYVTEEYDVKTRTDFNFSLVPDIINLEDVVVIGYGVVKKSDLTGSVASVTSEQLQQSSVSGVDQALQGRTAGVSVTANSGSPGSASSVRIRGLGTVTNPDPFYVVDGIPVSASEVGSLNAGDIESTEILKDASAAAIYGARAANGVVIITTKKGKAGSSSISFDAYTGVQSLAKKYEVMNQRDFINTLNEVKKTNENPDSLPSTDWQDEIFRKAPISNYQLSFLGGTDKTQYALIGSYFDQKGILKGTDYNRYSIRLNTSSEIKPWLKIGENANFISSTKHLVPEQDEYVSVVTCAINMDPATPVFDTTGGTVKPHAGIRNNIKNPVGTIERDLHTQKTTKLLDNIFLEIKPVEGLTFKTSLGNNMTRIAQSDYLGAYNESTTYFQLDNQYVASNFDFTSLMWENTLAFNKIFAQKHQVQILAGYSRQVDKYRFQLASSTNLPTQTDLRFIGNTSDPTTINYTDVSNLVGGIYYQNPYNPYDNLNVPYDAYLISYLGRVMYDYADLIDINASVRRDGSSKFGTNTKWGIFPAFAGGIKLSQLPVLKNSSAINFLKLRIGWGQLGNQEVGNYRAFTSVSPNMNYVYGAAGSQATYPGAAPLSIGNNDVKWESTNMTNYGLDIQLFKNSVIFNVDYFIRTTKDMLLEVPIPGLTGVSISPLVNKGSIQNKGLEINGVFKKHLGDFSYEVTANVSFIRNKVLELGSSNDYIQGGSFRASNFISRTEVGHPVASFYGYVTDGYWQRTGRHRCSK